MPKVFRIVGASNHTDGKRADNDFYATDPIAAERLIDIEKIPSDIPIWEPACGMKHLSMVFEKNGNDVRSSDIVRRTRGVYLLDFLKQTDSWEGYIVTNPPYALAQEFVEKAIELVTIGNKVCMFLKLQFLEGGKRKKFFERFPPKTVWVSSHRIACAINGDFEKIRSTGGNCIAYAWFVWEKGYKGETVIKWF